MSIYKRYFDFSVSNSSTHPAKQAPRVIGKRTPAFRRADHNFTHRPVRLGSRPQHRLPDTRSLDIPMSHI